MCHCANSVCESSIVVFSVFTDPSKGEYDAAQAMFNRALAIKDTALGKDNPDNPDTASKMRGLASMLYRNGDDDLTRTVTLTLLLSPILTPTIVLVTLHKTLISLHLTPQLLQS